MGFCLLDHGLCLPNCGCTSDLHLFDGFSGLVLILMPGNIGILCQFSPVGVEDSPGPEQLLIGFVHCPLQSKSFIRQAGWTGLGELRLGIEGDAGHIWSF